jgi:hypothetical protein
MVRNALLTAGYGRRVHYVARNGFIVLQEKDRNRTAPAGRHRLAPPQA